jgi:hypothetical protein
MLCRAATQTYDFDAEYECEDDVCGVQESGHLIVLSVVPQALNGDVESDEEDGPRLEHRRLNEIAARQKHVLLHTARAKQQQHTRQKKKRRQ